MASRSVRATRLAIEDEDEGDMRCFRRLPQPVVARQSQKCDEFIAGGDFREEIGGILEPAFTIAIRTEPILDLLQFLAQNGGEQIGRYLPAIRQLSFGAPDPLPDLSSG